mmetsp:Transcript_9865/g.15605  ORF Transcript_9865/g.15605 Transcript_9865/m.15605 type:complete len:99 (-) Transcript_9865:13-309(-)
MEFITISNGARVSKFHEYNGSTTKDEIVADLLAHGIVPDPELEAKFAEKKRHEEELHQKKLIRDGFIKPNGEKKTLTSEEKLLHIEKLKRDGLYHDEL